MKDVQDAIAELVNRLARIGQTVLDALDGMDSEQRLIIEFLAENPKVAESLQELSQNLARQRVIGGATEETVRAQEPLIKDEKIRKAVRAWAEVCGYDGACIVEYDKRANELSGIAHTTTIALGEVDFDLEDRKRYTIAELCGKEDE